MMRDLTTVLAHTRNRFLDEAQRRVLMWSGKDLGVLVSKRSSEPTDSFVAYVHRVAGIATTLGFTELGDAAARLEFAIKKYLLGNLAADQLEEDIEEFLTELALVSVARAA